MDQASRLSHVKTTYMQLNLNPSWAGNYVRSVFMSISWFLSQFNHQCFLLVSWDVFGKAKLSSHIDITFTRFNFKHKLSKKSTHKISKVGLSLTKISNNSLWFWYFLLYFKKMIQSITRICKLVYTNNN